VVPVTLVLHADSGGGGNGGAVGSAAGSGGGPVAAAMSGVAAAVAAAMPPGVPPATYKVIFKNGDDMRQDQLVIQMVRLMDGQLKRLGLDLRLTPYSVLATSPSTGVMEMVLDSFPISHVVENYARRGVTPIMAFLQKHSPGPPDSPYGISEEAMDTYVKSAAGYCVITYLLGIGDRHLDNIMLRKDGHFFHIDFGCIFGRDPKPFPAPMRLTVEMIAGMGGYDSQNYSRFKAYCCQAYNILRRSAGLITVLLQLMRDAGIADLHPDPALTIAKVHEKFRIDIDDEDADKAFLRLVDDSVAALFPAFLEVLHKMRVALR
jgi:phosphatidylinositol 3-kinase